MITYNGIISYFKDFADKHTQINSFTEGGTDKMDLKKINEYPVLHIDITGSAIQDNTIVYDVDAYIITGVNDDNTESRRDALASTLLIMQDLRSEFFKGKYIVTPSLLLRGDESISCTPIEDDFNNRVYGWSTSISVTGVNESTACNIPYPPLEIWDGLTFTSPVGNMDLMTWFSATENVQENATVTVLSGSYQINILDAFIKTDTFDMGGSPTLIAGGTGLKTYDNAKQGINLDYTDAGRFSYYYSRFKDSSGDTFDNSVFGFKVSHIKDAGSFYTTLFWCLDDLSSPTKGFIIQVGGSTATTVAHKNKVILKRVSDSSVVILSDVSDESLDYQREEALTLVVRASGEDGNNRVYCFVDGLGSDLYIDGDLDNDDEYFIGIGSYKDYGAVKNLSKFIFKELAIHDTESASIVNYTDLYRWLKNR